MVNTSPVDTKYDGFISYSHAADGLLAPRLQAGLQRFAKPWWQRRALRIFRDESSLSANPHLWSSITEALDESEWFVLLLSPDAAASPWVNQEIEYWKANRDPSRILPVLTDGQFGWDDGVVSGSSVPEQLVGVFDDEPRWVDLRFAKDETDLDLKDPRFADAVADIASALRGIPKDELASEEVKQHRRTIRTAWAGVALIGLLAVAATVFAFQSADNARLAEAEAVRANGEADRANQEAERANNQADRAEDNAAEASRQAALAQSRELAASSIAVRRSDPELATLLAVAAMELVADQGIGLFPQAMISLRQATQADLLEDRLKVSEGAVEVALMPDGESVIVLSQADGSVSRRLLADLVRAQWVVSDLALGGSFGGIDVSPDASVVAVPFTEADGNRSGVALLDAATGEQLRVVPMPDCQVVAARLATAVARSGFSPDGSTYGLLSEPAVGCSDEVAIGGTILFETESWTELARFGDAAEVSFTADTKYVLVHRPFISTELLEYPGLNLIKEFSFDQRAFPPRMVRISPDGRTLFVKYDNLDEIRPAFFDVESESFLGWGEDPPGLAEDALFLNDSSVLVMGSDSDVVFDARSGLPLHRLNTTATRSASVTSDGRVVVTGSAAGDVEVWDLGAAPAKQLVSDDGLAVWWVNPNQFIDGPVAGIQTFIEIDRAKAPAGAFDPAAPEDLPIVDLGIVVVDPDNGEVTASRPFATSGAQLRDGRFVLMRHVGLSAESDLQLGPIEVWDWRDDSVELLTECTLSSGDISPGSGVLCPDNEPMFGDPVVSLDGQLIAARAEDTRLNANEPGYDLIRFWDGVTLDVLGTVAPETAFDYVLTVGDGWVAAGVGEDSIRIFDSETGSLISEVAAAVRARVMAQSNDALLYIGTADGRVVGFDTSSWERIADWQATSARTRGLALSPDGSRLVVTGEDGLVAVWDISVTPPVLVDQIPAGAERISDAIWIDDWTVGVALAVEQGLVQWQVLSLDPDLVIAEARHGLNRTFTADECSTYRIDPCPTLEEMRGG